MSAYATTDGEQAAVCALCKDRAEAAGWLPAHLAGRGAGGPRRRGPGGLRIRERLVAYGERARRALDRPKSELPEADRPGLGRPSRESAEEVRTPRPAPRDPSRAAIEIFNGSHERRKVAGLIRSLGEPRVSVRAGAGPRGSALITVAWELSWYQWHVGAGGNGEAVRQVAKGTDLSEIPDPAPRWNASTLEDGALALEAAGGEA